MFQFVTLFGKLSTFANSSFLFLPPMVLVFNCAPTRFLLTKIELNSDTKKKKTTQGAHRVIIGFVNRFKPISVETTFKTEQKPASKDN